MAVVRLPNIYAYVEGNPHQQCESTRMVVSEYRRLAATSSSRNRVGPHLVVSSEGLDPAQQPPGFGLEYRY